jgi:hypothetical protein
MQQLWGGIDAVMAGLMKEGKLPTNPVSAGKLHPHILQRAFECAQQQGEEALLEKAAAAATAADVPTRAAATSGSNRADAESTGNTGSAGSNGINGTIARGTIKYFLATDSDFIRQAAQTLLGDRLLTTAGKPQHSSNSKPDESMKIAADWWMLGRGADRLVTVGNIQSTFSASAWQHSLRPSMMAHASSQGECLRGAAGMWGLDNFNTPDRCLDPVRAQVEIDSAQKAV